MRMMFAAIGLVVILTAPSLAQLSTNELFREYDCRTDTTWTDRLGARRDCPAEAARPEPAVKIPVSKVPTSERLYELFQREVADGRHERSRLREYTTNYVLKNTGIFGIAISFNRREERVVRMIESVQQDGCSILSFNGDVAGTCNVEVAFWELPVPDGFEAQSWVDSGNFDPLLESSEVQHLKIEGVPMILSGGIWDLQNAAKSRQSSSVSDNRVDYRLWIAKELCRPV